METVPQSLYQYSNIKPWQLRILEFYPGPKGTPLQGRLISATLAVRSGEYIAVTDAAEGGHLLEYRALSYTWGTSAKTHCIRLGSESLALTANLHSALEEVRDAAEPTLWWVDAICINQADVNERGEQVANMLHIFKTAHHVRIWLGEASEDSAAAMRYLAGLDSYINPSSFKNGDDSSIFVPLYNLYARPWLRRTWIRQEVYAAKAIAVHCGRAEISWQQFGNGLYLLEEVFDKSKASAQQLILNLPSVGRALIESTIPPVRHRKEALELAAVLMFTPIFHATDERDAVFAVLGMCSIPTSELKPDYTKPIEWVWTEVSKYLIRNTIINPEYPTRDWRDEKAYPTVPDMAPGQHHVFNYKIYKPGNIAGSSQVTLGVPSTQLPSWALDWRHQCDPFEIDDMLRCDPCSYPQFGSMVPISHCQVPTLSSDSTLRIIGWVWGVIAELTDLTCDLSACLKARSMSDVDSTFLRPYVHGTDTRRIARIHLQYTNSPALVPASARPGDVLVAIAPRVFPLVLSPVKESNVDLNRVMQVALEDEEMTLHARHLHFVAEALLRCRPDYEFRGPAIGCFAVNVPDVKSVDFIIH